MLNSILTAILYYLAMPCVMVFTFYFCRLDKEKSKLFLLLCGILYVPAVTFAFAYSPLQTREIAQAQPDAFRNVAIYNLIYGAASALLICISLAKERNTPQFGQRRMVVFIVLIPVDYWLITLFGFHLLKLEKLYKMWQGNIIILPVLFLFYVRQMFQDGAWGLRLQKEHFDWTEGESSQAKASSYLMHMVKNETAKIRWCADAIRDPELRDSHAEADIINRSVDQIEALLQRSSRYEKEIVPQCREVIVYQLFQEIREERLKNWNGRVIINVENTQSSVFCDYSLMKEVLVNLVENAMEAMVPGEEGMLTLRFTKPVRHRPLHRRKQPRRSNQKTNMVRIEVEDNGKGIPEEIQQKVFQPYYTNKKDDMHFGLGLSWCQKVVRRHGGTIEVKSPATMDGKGTVFTLYLPNERRKQRTHHEHNS
ncbi:MAG: HAMP domain-containing histidine kinase [Lachnospiraceae bacterium]|nr:HAMP domain-containing histidine kinase [Lachnospiraceae bacterium]